MSHPPSSSMPSSTPAPNPACLPAGRSSWRAPALAGAVAAVLLLATLPAPAQTARVMKPGQVTEAALIEDLALEPAGVPEGVKTRGFGPAPRAPGTSPARPAPAGRSSLMITFVTNSAQLTPEGIRVLDTVARALQSDSLAGFAFRIEGHADPRGQAELNQALSEQRARAVVDYLVQTRGILPERLVPLGKGSSELFDTRRPEAPENRRVTIITQR